MRGLLAASVLLLLLTPAAAATVRVVEALTDPPVLQETRPMRLIFTVRNEGNATVCPCSVAWLGYGANLGEDPTVPALAPGESVVVESHESHPLSRQERLSVSLQLLDLATYQEVSERTYHPFPVILDGRSNLTIATLTLDPPQPRRGDQVRLHVVGANSGNVSLSHVEGHVVVVGGAVLARKDRVYLEPGAEFALEATWRMDAEPRTLHIQLKAGDDPHEARAERTLVVEPAKRERGSPPPQMPDLVAVEGRAECPCGHYLYTDYEIVVRNVGNATSEAFVVQLGRAGHPYEGAEMNAGPLAAGEEVTLRAQTHLRPDGGVPVVVDLYDDVWESDETNNARRLDVPWRTPAPGVVAMLGALALAVALRRAGARR